MESNHLNKPVYKTNKQKKKKQKTPQKTTCESNNKHKEKQKDKHEDVKKEVKNHKMWRRRLRKSRFFFFRMFLSLYNYQSQANRYRKGLTYLKNRATTN